MPVQKIDRQKLRDKISCLEEQYVRMLLDKAIDLLSQTKLVDLVDTFINPKDLRPDPGNRVKLIDEVKKFQKASLKGDYYEDFNVNSKNYTQKSRGTQTWITDCHRLFGNCIKQFEKENISEIKEAFDIIFDLLDQIDECRDDIIFFADEGGSWQVNVHWKKSSQFISNVLQKQQNLKNMQAGWLNL